MKEKTTAYHGIREDSRLLNSRFSGHRCTTDYFQGLIVVVYYDRADYHYSIQVSRLSVLIIVAVAVVVVLWALLSVAPPLHRWNHHCRHRRQFPCWSYEENGSGFVFDGNEKGVFTVIDHRWPRLVDEIETDRRICPADQVYRHTSRLFVDDQYRDVYCLTSNEEMIRDREEVLYESKWTFNCTSNRSSLSLSHCLPLTFVDAVEAIFVDEMNKSTGDDDGRSRITIFHILRRSHQSEALQLSVNNNNSIIGLINDASFVRKYSSFFSLCLCVCVGVLVNFDAETSLSLWLYARARVCVFVSSQCWPSF